MDSTERVYELILLGATGYTGKYCAEHITTHLPSDLKWALAGRNASKLSALLEEIKPLNADRLPPNVESVTLNAEEISTLTKRTRVLINTIGPYHVYSTPVVEACAKNGTHYIDVTGESPWVLDMIRKYHDIAKANNAIIIHQNGVESAPADLVAWSLVSSIRDRYSVGTREVIDVMGLSSVPSGGTLATVLGLFDNYSLKQISASIKPYAQSPIPRPKPGSRKSLLTRFLGLYFDPALGSMTTSIAGDLDAQIVQRSQGLFDSGRYYGERFEFSEFGSTPNSFIGIVTHFALSIGMTALALAPVRWLLKKLIYTPGQGPSRESTSKDYLEHRAVGTADQTTASPGRAIARFRWNGSMYHISGVLLAEAAITILRDSTAAHGLGGGMLTPATLGQSYIDRLKAAGVIFEIEVMD